MTHVTYQGLWPTGLRHGSRGCLRPRGRATGHRSGGHLLGLARSGASVTHLAACPCPCLPCVSCVCVSWCVGTLGRPGGRPLGPSRVGLRLVLVPIVTPSRPGATPSVTPHMEREAGVTDVTRGNGGKCHTPGVGSLVFPTCTGNQGVRLNGSPPPGGGSGNREQRFQGGSVPNRDDRPHTPGETPPGVQVPQGGQACRSCLPARGERATGTGESAPTRPVHRIETEESRGARV